MPTADATAAEYVAARPKSAAAHQRAKGYFAADGATHFTRAAVPFRPYITHAAGPRKWDLDGHEYLDCVMGHGALVLGHAHPAVSAAIAAQVPKGAHYGDNHELEIAWAEGIRGHMPTAERIEYCASGMEATQLGLRLARVFTGRKRVLRFAACYHGWSDEVTAPGSAGAIAEYVKVIPAGNPDLVSQELASGEYACVLIEGGGARVSGRSPIAPDFYRALPAICAKAGTVFMLDEVVTGFREAAGGWQSVLGIRPDLTTIGKAASGGLPSGILLGRADIFASLHPASPPDRLVVHGGTWNAVPITCAAGIAACETYRGGEPQRRAAEGAARLRSLANAAFRQRGLAARVYGRSIVHIYLGPVERDDPNNDQPPTLELAKLFDKSAAKRYGRLDLHMLSRGVATLRGEAFIFSSVHTDQDVDRTAAALVESVAAVAADGLL
ncbi:MAG: aminotransferase class III-fold pyridoxal phosphate-dependent enzyme [Gemmatimonadetes bacterium]|nr:aminotransferase class III-fold pyridoxal phosphate-dependent enzyme [Gemmatimonadota bacterium]